IEVPSNTQPCRRPIRASAPAGDTSGPPREPPTSGAGLPRRRGQNMAEARSKREPAARARPRTKPEPLPNEASDGRAPAEQTSVLTEEPTMPGGDTPPPEPLAAAPAPTDAPRAPPARPRS